MCVEASGMKIKVSACGLFLLDKELLFSVGLYYIAAAWDVQKTVSFVSVDGFVHGQLSHINAVLPG